MIKDFRNLSKGQILIKLEDKLRYFVVPKTKIIRVSDWLRDFKSQLKFLKDYFFFQNKIKSLAIRSSAYDEDNKNSSKAGMYTSVLNVNVLSNKDIKRAINEVIKSYKKKDSNIYKSEIIIQEMILNVNTSGVIFTNDMNDNSPYYVVNYDDRTGLTNTVTSGSHKYSNMCLNVFRDNVKDLRSERFKKLLYSVLELEGVVGSKILDIEFVINKDFKIYLLQVREIPNKKIWSQKKNDNLKSILLKTNSNLKKKFKKQNGVIGKTTVFGQMPDWNPAEMIGKFPRNLSYSLYKKLITDKIWAEARYQMGYRVPKNKNLMISIGSQPYIDTRLSLNSFLPANLPKQISIKLVNFWLDKFKHNPILHDKIEFDLAITCYSFDIKSKLKKLVGNTLNNIEKKIYVENLKNLTSRFFDANSNFSIEKTLKKIDKLEDSQKKFKNLGQLNQLNNLIKDCKAYGTLPFSILARHGFVGITLLNSLKELKILTQRDVNFFLKSIKTVATEMVVDLNKIKKNSFRKKKFLSKYGHLRPGTYDIMSKSYDEMSYFKKDTKARITKEKNFFKLTIKQKKKINRILIQNGFKSLNYQKLLKYIQDSIAAREYSKFIFTKNVSNILKVLIKYGNNKSISRDLLSFVNIESLLNKKITKKKLIDESKKNKHNFMLTNLIKLPQIIHDETSAFIAPYQINIPNFITTKLVEGKSLQISSKSKVKNLDKKIILIEGADPGYDWIFSHKVSGLITKYGGANSHMAIRSAEFGLPAVIGCGENLFNELKNYEYISINCLSKEVKQLILN